MKNYLLVGRTGVGKSSFINATLGVTEAATNPYEACTSSVKYYRVSHASEDIYLIDTPGLGEEEDENLDISYTSLIKSCIDPSKIDSLIYITRLNETRFRGEEKKVLRTLIEKLDKRMWHSAALVLTFAASVCPDQRTETCIRRIQDISSFTRQTLSLFGIKFTGFRRVILIDNIQSGWTKNTIPVPSLLA